MFLANKYLYDRIRVIRGSSFTRSFKLISIRTFVHFMLSSLVLSEAKTLNKLISLSFLELLHLGKAVFFRHCNTFFRDNKVESQASLKRPMKLFSDVYLQSLF